MITLHSDAFDVLVSPDRGADIVQVTDRATSVPILAASPTGQVSAPRLASSDSTVQWINGSPGGWQLLAPNAGPHCVHDGVCLGFHGGAAVVRWSVLEQPETAASLATNLLAVPLQRNRRFELNGCELTLTDTITNLSPDPTSTRPALHPALGSRFLDERSDIVVHAETVITDADTPGSLAAADVVGGPREILTPGPVPHSIALPGLGSREALFAALTDFQADAANATFASPTHGFGTRLSWDPSIYANAWLWMEANAGSGWP